MKSRLTVTLSPDSFAEGVRPPRWTPASTAHYKGGSSFNLAGAGPNVARCGAFPENVELSFTGSVCPSASPAGRGARRGDGHRPLPHHQ